MKNTLLDIAGHLRASNYKNEEHVRVGVVCRLLSELGWDIWNPRAVVPELPATPKEDSTRVDLALFMPPQFIRPAVFIEVKAVGRLLPALDSAEIQLRDYNRNNQADISVLTDGRYWRFYLAQAAGEFSRKCFEKIDLLETDDALTDAELALDAFLSMKAHQSGTAVDEAKKYLKRTDTERVMFEALPFAQRDAGEDPTVSLVECFLVRCNEQGADCSLDQAIHFIKAAKSRSEIMPVRERNVGVGVVSHTSAKNSVPSQSFRREEGRLRLTNKRGANAEGEFRSNRFIVFKDSISAPTTDGFQGSYRDLRSQLEEAGQLVPELRSGIQVCRLTKDYEFNSASAAASVFCGRSANDGEWKK